MSAAEEQDGRVIVMFLRVVRSNYYWFCFVLTEIQDYVNFLKRIYYLRFHGVNLSISWLGWTCRYSKYILKWGKVCEIRSETHAIVLHNEGKSERTIAFQLRLSKTCVHNTITQYKESGYNQHLSRLGRSWAIIFSKDNFIVITRKQNRSLTAPEICAEVNKSRSKLVSLTTVKRRLRDAKLFARVAIRKLLLRPQNKKKRMQWALTHRDWTEGDF